VGVPNSNSGIGKPVVLIFRSYPGDAPEVKASPGVKVFNVQGDILGNLDFGITPFTRPLINALKKEFADAVASLPRGALRELTKHIETNRHYRHRRWALATLNEARAASKSSEDPAAVILTVDYGLRTRHKLLTTHGVAAVAIGKPMLDELQRASETLTPELKEAVRERMGDWDTPPIPSRPELSQ